MWKTCWPFGKSSHKLKKGLLHPKGFAHHCFYKVSIFIPIIYLGKLSLKAGGIPNVTSLLSRFEPKYLEFKSHMSFSNAFWVEVWSTPYFSLGSHFLFLLTLFPCCFPSEFVTLLRRAAVRVCSQCCLLRQRLARLWLQSQLKRTDLCETIWAQTHSQCPPSSRARVFLILIQGYLLHHTSLLSLQMLPGSVRELTSPGTTSQSVGVCGKTKTPAIIRQVDPSARHLLPSQRFRWTWAFYA